MPFLARGINAKSGGSCPRDGAPRRPINRGRNVEENHLSSLTLHSHTYTTELAAWRKEVAAA